LLFNDSYELLQVMNDEEAHFKYQDQFGRAYSDDEFLIFNVAVRYPETVVSTMYFRRLLT
jgi:hypothetical protein